VQGKADKALVTLAGHGDWVQQVVWDPSHEEQVASAADDKTIRCQSTGLLSPLCARKPLAWCTCLACPKFSQAPKSEAG